MPELPEVESVRRSLDRRRLRGRTIVRVRSSGMPLRMARPQPVTALRRATRGRSITALRLRSDTRSIRRSSWTRGLSKFLPSVRRATSWPRHRMAAGSDGSVRSEKWSSVSATSAPARFSYSPARRRSA